MINLQLCFSTAVTKPGEENVPETPATGGDNPLVVEAKVPEVEVDASHPEVLAMVEAAMKAAEQQVVSIPPDDYLNMLQQAIENLEKEKALSNPNGPG